VTVGTMGGTATTATSARRAVGWQVWLLRALLVAGIAARFAYVGRPFDDRLENPWRQSDYFQVARNFEREGMNILYPRIDWRGSTPGYTEMELPLLPWLGAALFHLVGTHVQVMRVLSAALESLTLLLFAGLARSLLPPAGALFATAAFALDPLLLLLAGSLQPEPAMHLLSIAAVVMLVRWQETSRPRDLFAAAALTGAAILCKLPALYLGLIFAWVVLRKEGRKALRDPRVYAAALLAVVPAAAWYLWAHGFWTRYGTSLGLSNESHLIGLDLLVPPKFLLGILKWETFGVFSPLGWLLALAAVWSGRKLGWRRVELPLVWYGAVWVFYLAAARTTADGWAYYYHVIAVAPGCLLLGAGFDFLRERARLPRRAGAAVSPRLVGGVLAAATLACFVAVTALRIERRDHDPEQRALFHCATEMRALVPPEGAIVVRGGPMFDEHGRPVAHNESMVFAWMDRKGFNYGDEELGIATLERIAAQGGRYWLARRGEIEGAGLTRAVASRYREIARCNGDPAYRLYDLRGLRDLRGRRNLRGGHGAS
jgi:dolichyl-phosphate-mannose-protein mannosyltransferase